MKFRVTPALVAGFVLTLSSCALIPSSRTKLASKRISAKYNVLFHADNALFSALESRTPESENILEPLSALPPAFLTYDTDTASSAFLDRAEEKAVKAIQKYSLIEAKKEKNEQLDRAYQVLGYTRYFSARPYPALEAFRKLAAQSNRSEAIAMGNLGEAFVFFSLQNFKAAKEALERFEISAAKKSSDRFLASLLAAQIAYEEGAEQVAIETLQKAMTYKAADSIYKRTELVLAKLLEQSGSVQEAQVYYKRLSKDRSYRFAPYRIVSQIAIEDIKAQSDSVYQLSMDRLLKRWNNYDHRALLFRAKGLKSLSGFDDNGLIEVMPERALTFFEAANRLGEPWLQVANFDTLVAFELRRKNYPQALSYLDSLLQRADGVPRAIFAQRTSSRKQIAELLDYLDRIKEIEELIALGQLPEEQRKDTLYHMVRQELEAKRNRERAEMLIDSDLTEDQPEAITEAVEDFYFARPEILRSGKLAFDRIWGPRANVDNWHVISAAPERLMIANEISSAPLKRGATGGEATIELLDNEIEQEVAARLGTIPSDASAIEKLKKEQIESTFSAASIYYYQFGDYENAVSLLNPLLDENQTDLVQANTLYTIYLLSSASHELERERYKKQLLTDFPESLFARHLTSSETGSEQIDAELAGLFDLQRFDLLAIRFDELREQGVRLSPSMALLFAKNQLRTKGLISYEIALEQLRLLYPNSYVSKEAKATLDEFQTLSKQAIQAESSKGRFTLLVDLSDLNSEQQGLKLKELNRILSYQNYLSNAYLDRFDSTHTLAAIHRFVDKKFIDEFISKHLKLIGPLPLYVVEESNYVSAYQIKDWGVIAQAKWSYEDN